MEPLKDFEVTLTYLKQHAIISTIQKGVQSYFVLHNHRVRVYSEQAHYYLPLAEFISLFHQESFYLHERKHEPFVSMKKDEEYYSWHKK